MERTAELSADGRYRYVLGRRWGGRHTLAWVMLNPSTADAEVDDPTIRRCVGFGRKWGFGGITVVNLFALRTVTPTLLTRHVDPVGPDNDDWIKRETDDAHWIMLGWGAHPFARTRAMTVLDLIGGPGYRVMSLGVTKDGSPRHPLYVPNVTGLHHWKGYR